MFERYTEKARRVIFFARYEASQFGQPYIETEHLLLGVLREDKALANRFLKSFVQVEEIRKRVEAHTPVREKTSTSVDLPLSNESKRVMAYAAEEAERLGHKHIGAEHLLLGLLREEKSFAGEMLRERGVQLLAVRKDLEREPHLETATRSRLGSGGPTAPSATSLSDFARDLTQAAMEGHLDPLVGREQELAGILEILSRRYNRNPILIGERGAGKSAIVEGLAQRIGDGMVPPAFANMRLLALDAQIVGGWALTGRNAEERMNHAIKALIDAADVILYVDDLHLLIEAASSSGSAVANGILKHWLLRGRLLCVGACTPGEYAEVTQAAPWVRDCFCEVHVHPLTEEATLKVLESRKQHFESFHGVKYADEALEFAVRSSGRYLPERPLPGKALELIDAAGAHVKLRQTALPEEIVESMKQVKFIVQRMESAVQNHEFEKARFYSEEERNERENLRVLREKHHLDEVPSAEVTGKDVEEMIARAAGYSFKP